MTPIVEWLVLQRGVELVRWPSPQAVAGWWSLVRQEYLKIGHQTPCERSRRIDGLSWSTIHSLTIKSKKQIADVL